MSPFPAGVAPTAPQHKLARQVAVEARSETQICDLCICHDLNLPQNRALWPMSLIALAVLIGAKRKLSGCLSASASSHGRA